MADKQGEKVGTGKRAVIYVRHPQYNERDRTSTEVQLGACHALADALGYDVADQARLQEDLPNTSLARPGITRLIGLVAQGEADAIITYTLDRLGRPESEGLEALLREIRRRGIQLYVANVPKGYEYDPTTGKLTNDPALVAAANREDARPPEYIVIPRETEQEDSLAALRALRNVSPAADGADQGDQN
jgi:DNA invertase Pin-like site-specific DNA recombinase